MFEIVVDLECSGNVWWDAFKQAPVIPAVLRPLLELEIERVNCTHIQAAEAFDWAATLEGWEGNDERAPHPLMLCEKETDPC